MAFPGENEQTTEIRRLITHCSTRRGCPDVMRQDDRSIRTDRARRYSGICANVMTASSALFIIDTRLVAVVWPLTAWLAVNNVETAPQALIFASANLAFLYALGLYRRDAVVDIGKSLNRIPLVVAIGVVAASFTTAALGWTAAAGAVYRSDGMLHRLRYAGTYRLLDPSPSSTFSVRICSSLAPGSARGT